MTECYECAKLAELVAENNALRGKVDELANDGKAPEKVVTTESVGANDANAALDSREKLEADVRKNLAIMKLEGYMFDMIHGWLDRQAAITERHILTHPDERDEQIAELQHEVDELTAERDELRAEVDKLRAKIAFMEDIGEYLINGATLRLAREGGDEIAIRRTDVSYPWEEGRAVVDMNGEVVG